MTRYYGYYSNVARGKRKKTDADDKIPCILEPELTDKASLRNWARLIQKIYETDPLFCPRCNGSMHVIACIEDDQMIKKILKHLDIWHVGRKPRPVAHAPVSCKNSVQPEIIGKRVQIIFLPQIVSLAIFKKCRSRYESQILLNLAYVHAELPIISIRIYFCEGQVNKVGFGQQPVKL